jgi:hypothetical protein
MSRRRGVTATDMFTGKAATQMDPAPADSKAITTGGFEIGGDWGQRRGVEMGTTSHRPAPFFASI